MIKYPNFRIKKLDVQNKTLCLEDTSNEQGGMTLTNGIEAALEIVRKNHNIQESELKEFDITYYDSENELTTVVYNGLGAPVTFV